MPVIQADTSAAEEMGPIEPGTYKARISEVTFKMSKANNPMLELKVSVTVDGKERTRKAYVVTSGAGAFNFDQLLRATGFDELANQYKDPSVTTKPPFDTDALLNKELQVVVDSYLYTPKDEPDATPQKRDQIKTYLRA